MQCENDVFEQHEEWYKRGNGKHASKRTAVSAAAASPLGPGASASDVGASAVLGFLARGASAAGAGADALFFFFLLLDGDDGFFFLAGAGAGASVGLVSGAGAAAGTSGKGAGGGTASGAERNE